MLFGLLEAAWGDHLLLYYAYSEAGMRNRANVIRTGVRSGKETTMKTKQGRSVLSSTGPGVLVTAAIVFVASASLGAQQPAASQGQVTFARDVAPILQRSCQNCHRPGSVAPMSLLTYEEARPWARAIKQRVSSREMP